MIFCKNFCKGIAKFQVVLCVCVFLHNAMTDYLFVLHVVACLQKKNTEDKTKIVLPVAQGSTSDITPRAMAMENNHDAKIYNAL